MKKADPWARSWKPSGDIVGIEPEPVDPPKRVLVRRHVWHREKHNRAAIGSDAELAYFCL